MSTPIFDNASGVTTDQSGLPTKKPSGKVAAGALAGLALTVVVAALGAITPELLDFLGPWSSVAFVAIGALATSLASYIKRPTGIS